MRTLAEVGKPTARSDVRTLAEVGKLTVSMNKLWLLVGNAAFPTQ
jgi:hypothetical protein